MPHLVHHRLQHPVRLRPDEVYRRSPPSEQSATTGVRRREAAQRECPGLDAGPALYRLRSPGPVCAVPEPGRQQVPTRGLCHPQHSCARRHGLALRQVPSLLGQVRQRVQPQSLHALRSQSRRGPGGAGRVLVLDRRFLRKFRGPGNGADHRRRRHEVPAQQERVRSLHAVLRRLAVLGPRDRVRPAGQFQEQGARVQLPDLVLERRKEGEVLRDRPLRRRGREGLREVPRHGGGP